MQNWPESTEMRTVLQTTFSTLLLKIWWKWNMDNGGTVLWQLSIGSFKIASNFHPNGITGDSAKGFNRIFSNPMRFALEFGCHFQSSFYMYFLSLPLDCVISSVQFSHSVLHAVTSGPKSAVCKLKTYNSGQEKVNCMLT